MATAGCEKEAILFPIFRASSRSCAAANTDRHSGSVSARGSRSGGQCAADKASSPPPLLSPHLFLGHDATHQSYTYTSRHQHSKRICHSQAAPSLSACWASIMLPVRTISMALALPMARMRRCVPPHPVGHRTHHHPSIMHDSQSLSSPDRTRNNTKGDLRLSELGVVGSDDDVTHHGQFAPPAQGISRHRCNRLPCII